MEENLKELELELLKMNIKRTQGLQPADAGKYHHLKKKIAALKNKIAQEELKAAKTIKK
jgi:ribosomal protein L29